MAIVDADAQVRFTFAVRNIGMFSHLDCGLWLGDLAVIEDQHADETKVGMTEAEKLERLKELALWIMTRKPGDLPFEDLTPEFYELRKELKGY